MFPDQSKYRLKLFVSTGDHFDNCKKSEHRLHNMLHTFHDNLMIKTCEVNVPIDKKKAFHNICVFLTPGITLPIFYIHFYLVYGTPDRGQSRSLLLS